MARIRSRKRASRCLVALVALLVAPLALAERGHGGRDDYREQRREAHPRSRGDDRADRDHRGYERRLDARGERRDYDDRERYGDHRRQDRRREDRRFERSGDDRWREQHGRREFQSLAPRDQQRLRETEQRYRQLSPEEQELLRRRWDHMSADERARYRREIERRSRQDDR